MVALMCLWGGIMLYDLGPANPHAKLCLSKAHFIPWRIKEALRNRGEWEDLIQELHAVAWEAFVLGLETRETFKLVNTRVGQFMKAYGLSKYAEKRYGIREVPFSDVFDHAMICDRGLRDPGLPLPAPPVHRTLYRSWEPEECEERILALIKKRPGISRREICHRLILLVKQAESSLKKLVDRGLAVEVRRRRPKGRPPAPLYFPADNCPEEVREEVRQAGDRDKRIRHAYFVEGKSIKRVAKELQCSRETVRSVIGTPRPKGRPRGRRRQTE